MSSCTIQVLEETASAEVKQRVKREKMKQEEQNQRMIEAAAYTGMGRKGEVRSADILERHFRIELLWDKLRRHAFEVGRAVVAAKRETSAAGMSMHGATGWVADEGSSGSVEGRSVKSVSIVDKNIPHISRTPTRKKKRGIKHHFK